MKTYWNKLLDWIVKLKFPFYIDKFGTIGWKWYGSYGKTPSSPRKVEGEIMKGRYL